MHDGSRNFVLLPQSRSPLRLLFHVFTLPGAVPTNYVPSMIAGSWIDFRYKGQKFSINNQYGDFWFFVRDPSCPESVLTAVAAHFSKILSCSNAL
jgi:hypothetical protein